LLFAGNPFVIAFPILDQQLQDICSSKLLYCNMHNPGGWNNLGSIDPGFGFCGNIAGAEKVVLPLYMPGRPAP
jgi:hypothetical protein